MESTEWDRTKRRDVTFDENTYSFYVEDVLVDAIPPQVTTLDMSNEPKLKMLEFDQTDSEEENPVSAEDPLPKSLRPG
jgi:hypothetical protein